MEVFSNLIKSRFEMGQIRYHPKTQRLKISHLMFADDVMVFYDGSVNSLHGIREALEDFGSWSGLRVNEEKSKLYIAGATQEVLLLSRSFGYSMGQLPVRYLGLPLMCRKLRVGEYEPLIDRIVRRCASWPTKSLTFSGRAQLISSVIMGMVVFWISTFLLPKGCLDKIESLCSRFLWTGELVTGKGAKISWGTCCLPRDEGGIGLRRIKDWNVALALRLVWALFSGTDSLWSRWNKQTYLKEKSFWELIESQNQVWTWRVILRLRPLAKRFIACKLGNGRLLSFWHDQWTPFGPLNEFLTEDAKRRINLTQIVKVADSFSSQGWHLPSPRSEGELQLHTFLTTIPLGVERTCQDEYLWKVSGVPSGEFSSAKVWDEIRTRGNVKSWARIVWFKGYIPSHAFNFWVAQQDRLPTRARMAAWSNNYNLSASCFLCSGHAESRNHLFFSCNFTHRIWKMVWHRLDPGCTPLRSWDEMLSWIERGGNTRIRTLRALVSQALVYHVWRHRNNRLHSNVSLPASIIFKKIDLDTRNVISGRRSSKHWRHLMLKWIR